MRRIFPFLEIYSHLLSGNPIEDSYVEILTILKDTYNKIGQDIPVFRSFII